MHAFTFSRVWFLVLFFGKFHSFQLILSAKPVIDCKKNLGVRINIYIWWEMRFCWEILEVLSYQFSRQFQAIQGKRFSLKLKCSIISMPINYLEAKLHITRYLFKVCFLSRVYSVVIFLLMKVISLSLPVVIYGIMSKALLNCTENSHHKKSLQNKTRFLKMQLILPLKMFLFRYTYKYQMLYLYCLFN